MEKTRILFINAIDFRKEIERCYPPLGLGYLAASLRQRFGNDFFQFKIINRAVEEEIKKFKPDLVGISSVSQNYNLAIEYARTAKKYHRPVIIGGFHISMMSSSLTKDMEVGIIGEGEETICELLESFERKKRFDWGEMQKIKGVIYWGDKDKIIFTGRRDLIYPLDKIPLPARDLFEIQKNTYVFSSRGCPYRCTFCASSRFWDRVRLFSAEYVVNEIQHLIDKYNVKYISFYDDLFVVNPDRVRQIVNLLKIKNILGKVEFWCAIRADLVKDEIIGLLREMGVRAVGLGFESGDNDTLKYLKGDIIDIKDNENAVRIIKKYNLEIHGSFIIGSPKEKKEDILKTLRFIKKSRLTGFDIHVLFPLPGTPVWDYARTRGLVNEKMDWFRLKEDFADNHDSAIILSEKLTREEIYGLFLRFKRYQKRRKIYNLVKKGLRNPLRIPDFLIRKIRKYWGRDGKIN